MKPDESAMPAVERVSGHSLAALDGAVRLDNGQVQIGRWLVRDPVVRPAGGALWTRAVEKSPPVGCSGPLDDRCVCRGNVAEPGAW